ncbi:MAG: hypothetical protein D6805_09415 [Planctomycetota bacterium]|nr:MAG: hypothetical protein D6805_09415 [Planctomycetota bacterium]
MKKLGSLKKNALQFYDFLTELLDEKIPCLREVPQNRKREWANFFSSSITREILAIAFIRLLLEKGGVQRKGIFWKGEIEQWHILTLMERGGLRLSFSTALWRMLEICLDLKLSTPILEPKDWEIGDHLFAFVIGKKRIKNKGKIENCFTQSIFLQMELPFLSEKAVHKENWQRFLNTGGEWILVYWEDYFSQIWLNSTLSFLSQKEEKKRKNFQRFYSFLKNFFHLMLQLKKTHLLVTLVLYLQKMREKIPPRDINSSLALKGIWDLQVHLDKLSEKISSKHYWQRSLAESEFLHQYHRLQANK